jgi:hypothetical protein
MPPHTKLTPVVSARICAALAKGNYYKAAARAGGVDYATFWRWLERGAATSSGPYRAFAEAVEEAEAQAERRIVAAWQKHVPTDWKAARDFLARRFPAEWGPRERHEVTGAGGGALEATVHIRAVDYRAAVAPLAPDAEDAAGGVSASGPGGAAEDAKGEA